MQFNNYLCTTIYRLESKYTEKQNMQHYDEYNMSDVYFKGVAFCGSIEPVYTTNFFNS